MKRGSILGKFQVRDLSRRLITRVDSNAHKAEFSLNGAHWIYSEHSSLRRLLMIVARVEASKLSQALRVDALKIAERFEKLIAIITVKISGSRDEVLQPSNNLHITIQTQTERRTLSAYGADGSLGLLATHLELGQGLGNQLWAYAALRTAALRTGIDFAVTGESNYKGKSFLDIDFGYLIDVPGSAMAKNFATVRENLLRTPSGTDVSPVDENILRPEPNSLLIGNFQSYKYIAGYEREVRSAVVLRDEPMHFGDNVTVLHVRMGDFLKNDVWLGAEYYFKAMAWIRERNPKSKFLIVSDQPRKAARLLKLKDYDLAERPLMLNNKKSPPIAPHHHGRDLRGDFNLMYSARSIVMPASSLSWWAAFLSLDQKHFVIAPDRWAAHNLDGSHWSTAEIATPGYSYMSRDGKVRAHG